MASKRHLIDGDVLRVAKAGACVGTRRTVNLIEGANVTLTVADNAGADRVDVTLAASGAAAGVSSFNTRTGAVTLTEGDVEGALTSVTFDNAQIRLAGESGQVWVNGVKVLGKQGDPIANAVDGPDAISKLNALLARLRTHGLIGT